MYITVPILCLGAYEDQNHIFFSCPFSSWVRGKVMTALLMSVRRGLFEGVVPLLVPTNPTHMLARHHPLL